ncbi:low affinity iron permease family protein [Sinorhizobium meliloti]|uniref:low affinity iron permease family protein n=1 Tax=Rhizobium meliloti TaxID=382 RepID=UPI00047524AD|nr:low affinity iron permease family protein [Sinorhizobium meliloti]
MPKANGFSRFASTVAEYSGRPSVFVLALISIAVWGLTGPIFGFSETWQLVINTGTTIVTFLMVFVLQNTQNRDVRALHAKLDELILTSAAENSYVGIERLDEKELKRLAEILQQHAHDDDDDDHTLREKVSSVISRRPPARS